MSDEGCPCHWEDIYAKAADVALQTLFSDEAIELLTGKPTPGQIAFGLRREGDR